MNSSRELTDCPCAGSTLDRLVQPAILVVLAEGPLHGYGIAERIGQMGIFGDRKPDVSGVYRFLKGMESKGMVTSSWGASEGGPARKVYQITSLGEHCLRKWIETLEDYRQGIAVLLKSGRRALTQ